MHGGMKPYESALSRVRAMYRVLPIPAPNRALELCFNTPSILSDSSWPGEYALACDLYPGVARGSAGVHRATDERVCVADYRRDLPFAAASFDIVICHQSLERLAAEDGSMRDPRILASFIRRISNVLVQDGILALCVTNATMLARWKRRWRKGNADDGVARGSLSIDGWRTLLTSSGFQRIQSFSVLPDADAPLRLINTDSDLSRIGFRREIESVRSSLSFPAYLLRRALVETSLFRYRQPSVLAWGHRS